jgi:hypothetical protein
MSRTRLQRAKRSTRDKVHRFRRMLETRKASEMPEWWSGWDCAYCRAYDCEYCPIGCTSGSGACVSCARLPRQTKAQWRKFLDFVCDENRKAKER